MEAPFYPVLVPSYQARFVYLKAKSEPMYTATPVHLQACSTAAGDGGSTIQLPPAALIPTS